MRLNSTEVDDLKGVEACLGGPRLKSTAEEERGRFAGEARGKSLGVRKSSSYWEMRNSTHLAWTPMSRRFSSLTRLCWGCSDLRRLGAQTSARLREVIPVTEADWASRCRCRIRWDRVLQILGIGIMAIKP